MADVKTATAKAKTATRAAGKPKNRNHFWTNLIVVILAIVVGWLIYEYVIGAPSHFNDPDKTQPKDFIGNMYLGGFVVPFLMALFLTMLTFVIERGIAVFKATGKVNGGEFVRKVQYHLANKNIDAALAECDKQSGSVGNVMKSGLVKYREMAENTELTTDQKILSIQNEIEESTALELPTVEKNLIFLSTIASISTLLGLFGTVLGMIRAFMAMAQAGAPDATQLAAGISEALYNTGLGIITAFFAVIAYNFYTTMIDGISYSIDESGFTLTQSFRASHT